MQTPEPLDTTSIIAAVHTFVRSEEAARLLNEYTGGTWLSGGCGLLAEAIQKAAGRGTIIGIKAKNGVIQHYGCDLSSIIDAERAYTTRGRWKAAFEKREGIRECTVVELPEWPDATLWSTTSDACANLIRTIAAQEHSTYDDLYKPLDVKHTLATVPAVIQKSQPPPAQRIGNRWMGVDITISSHGSLGRDESETSYYTEVSANLLTDNDDEEGDEFITIGTLEGWLIAVDRIIDERCVDLLDVLDSISQSACEAYEVFFEKGYWRRAFEPDDLLIGPQYFFIVNEIKLDKEWRGQELGIALLDHVLGSSIIPVNTIAALFPCPVEDQGISKEAATKKLQKHWKKAGVKSAGDGWYYRHIAPYEA